MARIEGMITVAIDPQLPRLLITGETLQVVNIAGLRKEIGVAKFRTSTIVLKLGQRNHKLLQLRTSEVVCEAPAQALPKVKE